VVPVEMLHPKDKSGHSKLLPMLRHQPSPHATQHTDEASLPEPTIRVRVRVRVKVRVRVRLRLRLVLSVPPCEASVYSSKMPP